MQSFHIVIQKINKCYTEENAMKNQPDYLSGRERINQHGV